MRYTRRDFGKLAIGALPAAALLNQPFRAFAATKPDSVINGVHVSTITYSYRSMLSVSSWRANGAGFSGSTCLVAACSPSTSLDGYARR